MLARKEQFKDKPKNTMLRVRVDDETVDKLEEIAKKRIARNLVLSEKVLTSYIKN